MNQPLPTTRPPLVTVRPPITPTTVQPPTTNRPRFCSMSFNAVVRGNGLFSIYKYVLLVVYNFPFIEDTKVVIRTRKPKDRHYNGHKRIGVELWCLMPLSTIFRLYRGGLFRLVEETRVPGETQWPQDKEQIDKQMSTKHNTENYRLCLTGHTINR